MPIKSGEQTFGIQLGYLKQNLNDRRCIVDESFAVIGSRFVFGFCQGEVEIKDGEVSSSEIRIEIEKLGPTEALTEGIAVNQTLFDVGYGAIFMLQLVGCATP